MKITVEQQSPDGLSRKAWLFTLTDLDLCLTGFARQTRPTRRHGWKGEGWNAYAHPLDRGEIHRPAEIPTTVIAEAIKKLTIHIRNGTRGNGKHVADAKMKLAIRTDPEGTDA